MKERIITRIAALLLAIMACSTAMAQYDPENPPEPTTPDTPTTPTMVKVSAKTQPAEAGYTYGSGSYEKGSNIYISTSAASGYEFLYWTKNGAQYSTSQWFNYEVEATDVEFVAVYQYNPESPSEPYNNYAYKLYLDSSPKEGCSFNLSSGSKFESGTWVYLYAWVNQDYEFLGWYENGSKISDNTSFQYQMKAQDCYLVAKCKYNFNPPSPDEPTSQQTDVDNPTAKKGDVNGDGIVDITDAVALVNRYLEGTTASLSLAVADMNNDGVIDITDAVAIVNKYLKNE